MDYFVTVQGIINEHPQLSSHVKRNINPVVTAVKCSLVERKEYGDHVNLTLRTSSGIVIHKIIMKFNQFCGGIQKAYPIQYTQLAEYAKLLENTTEHKLIDEEGHKLNTGVITMDYLYNAYADCFLLDDPTIYR